MESEIRSLGWHSYSLRHINVRCNKAILQCKFTVASVENSRFVHENLLHMTCYGGKKRQWVKLTSV